MITTKETKKEMYIELFISIVLGSILICLGISLIPVGGSEASQARNAGIAANAPVIAIILGMIIVLNVLYLIKQPVELIILSGCTTTMMSMAVLMLFSNFVYIYGVGLTPASDKYEYDPITGYIQDEYITENSSGHGIPTISYISGLIGSFIFAIGGSVIFYKIYTTFTLSYMKYVDDVTSIILSILLFFIIVIISSYKSGINTQGLMDKNLISDLKPALTSCILTSVLLAIFHIIIVGGML